MTKAGRPKKYREPMGTTTVTAPHQLLEEGRRRGINFSEVFREALRMNLGFEEEKRALETEANALETRAALLRKEAERRDDREEKRNAMYAAWKIGGRPKTDREDLSWIKSIRLSFGLEKVNPRDLLNDFKSRPDGREVR